jgi:hypothetical protein
MQHQQLFRAYSEPVRNSSQTDRKRLNAAEGATTSPRTVAICFMALVQRDFACRLLRPARIAGVLHGVEARAVHSDQ